MTWRCILGLHDDTEVFIDFPIYRKRCIRCGKRWRSLAFGSWRRER